MINRAALILKAKQPFVQWINESGPKDPASQVSMAEINEDRTVYLIDSLDAENLDHWIALNCANLFESELEDWITDQSLWPPSRDLPVFREWFAIECHTVLIDTCLGPIADDEV